MTFICLLVVRRCKYLTDEFLVDGLVAVGAVEGLLEEGEQDRDDDDGLKALTKDDEEDRDGEDVGSHCLSPFSDNSVVLF